MNKYIKIMRLDHWIKQMFITPGIVCAYLLTDCNFNNILLLSLLLGFLSTSIIASANYVINEYLDREFDKYHPVKKHRSAVEDGVNGKIVFLLWLILTCVGFTIGFFVNIPFLIVVAILWLMGILYNVKPIRTKDIPFVDVLSESINNALRFMLGWFIISDNTMAPSSILFGYWMGGAFLMAIKRYAEYRMIGNPDVASLYRKSFSKYTEQSLLISAFFYAMCSVFFIGVFLIKYKIELLLWIPFLIGLFCYYFYISFKEDSAVQKPEKLYKEKGLLIYCSLLMVTFIVLIIVDIPVLHFLGDMNIIKIGE